MKHKIHNIVILGALLLASCTDLSVSRFTGEDPDMDEYTSAPVLALRAEQSPDNVVTMTFTHGEGQQTRDIYLQATRPAENNIIVDFSCTDNDIVKQYSEQTGIEYKLLPAAYYNFRNGNYIDIQRGAVESEVNTLTVSAKTSIGDILEPGRYLLPIVGTSLTEELSDSTVFVDVNVTEPYTDPDGYELYTGDDMFTVFYLNTTEYDPRLANDMILEVRESGVYSYYGIGNIVNLRTTSVGYDSSTGKVSVTPSADLRYILEHYSERVQPVQDSGRKVCICIEGGGQGIGFCNFTDEQIEDFVASVKRLADTYPIDGINLWDRNTGYDRAAENGFPEMNTTSYPKLITALREALGPNRLLTLVDYEEPTEYFHDTQATGGIEVGQYIDYAWSGYCSENEPVQIVDPWHQGMSPVSELHPRQPIAGLDAKYYGCIHATWYTGEDTAQSEKISDWVQNGYRQNGISVYYDIRSRRQDKFESSIYAWPSYILQLLANDNGVRMQINVARMIPNPDPNNPNYNQYDKWVKDW